MISEMEYECKQQISLPNEQELESFKIGSKFSSLEEFYITLTNYQKEKFSDFSIVDSKTLDRAKKRYASPRIQNAPPELKYYYIKYSCVHGGLYERNSKIVERNSSTRKMKCPAMIFLTLSDDGKSLEVKKLIESHNHELSSQLFKSLPKQRRLDPETQQEIMELMQLKANKRLIQKKYSALTGKKITLRDLSNLRIKAKSRNVKFVLQPSDLTLSQKFRKAQVSTKQILSKSWNYKVVRQPSDLTLSQKFGKAQVSTKQISKQYIVKVVPQPKPSDLTVSQNFRKAQVSSKQICTESEDVVPQPMALTTSQKLRKAQVMTNKLAMLMSESPFFQEQLSFLQTVYDSWTNGKVSLEIRNKGPTDLSTTSHPESLSGLVPNRSITESSRTSSGLKTEEKDNASISPLTYLLLPLTNRNAASSNNESLSRRPVRDSNVSALYVNLPADAKIRGRPVGISHKTITAIRPLLKKQRETGTVPDPTPSTSGTATGREQQTPSRGWLNQHFQDALHVLKEKL